MWLRQCFWIFVPVAIYVKKHGVKSDSLDISSLMGQLQRSKVYEAKLRSTMLCTLVASHSLVHGHVLYDWWYYCGGVEFVSCLPSVAAFRQQYLKSFAVVTGRRLSWSFFYFLIINSKLYQHWYNKHTYLAFFDECSFQQTRNGTKNRTSFFSCLAILRDPILITC